MSTISIPLTQGKFTLIDDEDYVIVNQHRWHAVQVTEGYWYACTGCPRLYLHRLLLGDPDGLVVDHINGDGLDNRRANLQKITHAQNIRRAPQNHKRKSSQFRGVRYFRWGTRKKRWAARIKFECNEVKLGYYLTEEDAARAYDRAARELHGEFAVLNFPEEEHNTADTPISRRTRA